ncbi:helix-turn-helix domain-containing protein [Spirosoma fluminis]
MEVPTKEEFNQLKEQLCACQRDLKLVMGLLTGQQWISREQAMTALDVSKTTLWKLTKLNQIAHRHEGRKILYEVFSVRSYLEKQKIDPTAVDQRLLRAAFA